MNRKEKERNSRPARKTGAALTYEVLYLEEIGNLPTSQKGETSSSVNTGKVDKASPRCTFHAGKIFRVSFAVLKSCWIVTVSNRLFLHICQKKDICRPHV